MNTTQYMGVILERRSKKNLLKISSCTWNMKETKSAKKRKEFRQAHCACAKMCYYRPHRTSLVDRQ
jgi:hypothetical protein